MQQKSDNQLALFIRDEQSGRLAFNAQALRALGVDPAEARDRGYSITNVDEFQPDLAAYNGLTRFCSTSPYSCGQP